MCESSSVQKERHQREASERKTHKIANMQWSLFVLILMGQCSFCLCYLYKYHFVKEDKTWTEAQRHCREKYTDLATVFDMTDVKRLNDSAEKPSDAWIGLHKPTDVSRTWLWSLPEVTFNGSEKRWADNEPQNNVEFPENCVTMNKDEWYDVQCSYTHRFICYNETEPKTFHFINNKMKWLQAQSYCREHHTDLVSGLRQLNDSDFMTETKPQDDEHVWIGLFRETWRWSDGSNFYNRLWDLEQFEDEYDKRCAMTVSNGNWRFDKCSEKKPFFCYDDEVILIKENKTWEQALAYCRVNHSDLVSITNSHQQRWVEETAKQANTTHVWLGLRYSCPLDLWFWVSDNLVCYDNWAPGNKTEECNIAVAMSAKNDHKWFSRPEEETYNFICALNNI